MADHGDATHVALSPIMLQVDEHLLLSCLRRRRHLWRFKIAAMFAFGTPLSLIGPLLLATMFWFVAWMFDYRGLHWSWFFWPAACVVIPLLYRLEIRTRGDYLGTAMTATEPLGPPGWSLMPGPYGVTLGIAGAAANPTRTAAGLVEIFLLGPRLVLGAYRQWRLARRLRGVDLRRAAEVVSVLRSSKRGVEPARLLHKGEKPTDLLPALAYLSFHQWIDASECWRRIWLPTEVRERLGG